MVLFRDNIKIIIAYILALTCFFIGLHVGSLREKYLCAKALNYLSQEDNFYDIKDGRLAR